MKFAIFFKSGKILMQNWVRWKGGRRLLLQFGCSFWPSSDQRVQRWQNFPLPPQIPQFKGHTKSILTTALHYLGKNLIDKFFSAPFDWGKAEKCKNSFMFTFVLFMRQKPQIQSCPTTLQYCRALDTRGPFTFLGTIIDPLHTQQYLQFLHFNLVLASC